MSFATYANYNTGSSFDLLRTRAKKAVCLITSWVSDRPFSLTVRISQGCRAAWGFGRAKHDFRVRLSIAGATIASRARTRSRRRRPRDPAGDDDVSRAHARCRAAAERVETRARRRLPRPRRCREAASRRRPLFHDTARGDVPCLGRMAREAVARDGKRLETQPRVHADVPVDVERRRGGRRGVLVVALGGSERFGRILGVGSRVAC